MWLYFVKGCLIASYFNCIKPMWIIQYITLNILYLSTCRIIILSLGFQEMLVNLKLRVVFSICSLICYMIIPPLLIYYKLKCLNTVYWFANSLFFRSHLYVIKIIITVTLVCWLLMITQFFFYSFCFLWPLRNKNNFTLGV